MSWYETQDALLLYLILDGEIKMKLLARPRPYWYESLSSYIKRVADDNYCSQFQIKSLWKIPYYLSSAKINCNLTEQTYRAIKESMSLTSEKVKALGIDQFGDDVWKCTSENYLQVDRSNFVNETKQNIVLNVSKKITIINNSIYS